MCVHFQLISTSNIFLLLGILGKMKKMTIKKTVAHECCKYVTSLSISRYVSVCKNGKKKKHKIATTKSFVEN